MSQINATTVDCTRCTMPTTLQFNNTIGKCSTCESWYCPTCKRFELQMNASCLECSSPRPRIPQTPPTTSTVKTPPSQYPGNQQPRPNAQPSSSTLPIFQGTVINSNPPPSSVRTPTSSGPILSGGVVIANASASSSSNTNNNKIATVSPIRTADEIHQNISSQMARQHSADNTNNPIVISSQAKELSKIESIRATCRAANTIYVDCFNSSEFKNLDWGMCIPTPQNHGQPVLRPKSKDNQWFIFPPEGPRPEHIEQRSLGTCWFLSAAAVLAGVRPDLIEALFPVREVNPEGVFAVRLWTVGKFETIILDGSFPVVNRRSIGGGFFSRGASSEKADFKYCTPGDGVSLWPALLEKALAKLYNSYESCCSGTVAEAFTTLTGYPTKVLHIGDKEFDEDQAKTPDELFQILHSFSTSDSTMGASCGGQKVLPNVLSQDGTPVTKDQIAESYNLRAAHAYAILSVDVCPVTKRKLVLLRDPWNRTECRESEEGPSGAPAKIGQGEFWMNFEKFTSCFSNVTACFTRRFVQRLVAPSPAICQKSSSYLPRNFSEASIMFKVHKTCEVFGMVCQPEIRVNYAKPEKCNGNGYFDIGAFLIRLPTSYSSSSFVNNNTNDNSTIPTLVAVAGTRNLRVAYCSVVCDPGTYVLVPFSFQQFKAVDQEMTCNLLNEHAGTVSPLAFPADSEARSRLIHHILGTSHRWLFQFLASSKKCTIEQSKSDVPWITYDCNLGESRIIAQSSFSKQDLSIAVDTTQNRGVFHPGREDTAGNANVVLPAGHCAIFYWSVPLPFGKFYSSSSTAKDGGGGSTRGFSTSNGAAFQSMLLYGGNRGRRPGSSSVAGSRLPQQSTKEGGSVLNALKQLMGYQNQSSTTSSSGYKIIDPNTLPDEPGSGFEDVPCFMKPFRVLH